MTRTSQSTPYPNSHFMNLLGHDHPNAYADTVTHPDTTPTAVDGVIPVSQLGQVTEYQLTYTSGMDSTHEGMPSTHEIVEDPDAPGTFWVAGQSYDTIVKFSPATGQVVQFPMPDGSGPHEILFNQDGKVLVSLEFSDQVVEIDRITGEILQTISVDTDPNVLTGPHDISLGPDGTTIWFIGKAAGTVGKINPDGTVVQYPLPTETAAPPYLIAGPDGNMWGTEGDGASNLFRVTPDGVVTEYPLTLPGGTPTVLIPAPFDQPYLWFADITNHAVGRVDMQGGITEYVVPRAAVNMQLNGLAFDRQGDLYTLSYVNPKSGPQGGPEFVVELSNDILNAPPGDLSGVAVTQYRVPSTGTLFHRIILGSDGNMYFTELGTDRIGQLNTSPESLECSVLACCAEAKTDNANSNLDPLLVGFLAMNYPLFRDGCQLVVSDLAGEGSREAVDPFGFGGEQSLMWRSPPPRLTEVANSFELSGEPRVSGAMGRRANVLDGEMGRFCGLGSGVTTYPGVSSTSTLPLDYTFPGTAGGRFVC